MINYYHVRIAWLILAAWAWPACSRSNEPTKQDPLAANDPCSAPPTTRANLPQGTDPDLGSMEPNILVRIVSVAPLVGETMQLGESPLFGPRDRFPVGALPPGAAFPRRIELAPGVEAPKAGDLVKLRIVEGFASVGQLSPGAEAPYRQVTQIAAHASRPKERSWARVGVNLSGLIALLDQGSWSIHVFADGGYTAWTNFHASYGTVSAKTISELAAAFRASSFDRMPDVAATAYSTTAQGERSVLPGTLARTCGVARAVRVDDDPEGLASIVSALRAIYDAEMATTEPAIWAKPAGEIIQWPLDAPPLHAMTFGAPAERRGLPEMNNRMSPDLATSLKVTAKGAGDFRGGLASDRGRYYRIAIAPCDAERAKTSECVPDSYALITAREEKSPRQWPRPIRLATATSDRGAAVPAFEPPDFYQFWDEEFVEDGKLYRVHYGRRRRM